MSGAGKTETAKLLLGHLASVAGSEEGGVGSERIQHMVECTVVLESFGNAVMVRAVFEPHIFCVAPHTAVYSNVLDGGVRFCDRAADRCGVREVLMGALIA